MLRRPATLLIACLLLMLPTLPAAAADFSPGCSDGVGDAAALQTAVTTANGNEAADTITLAAGCTYTLTSTLTVNADGGRQLTINGNGATISGNNARRVLSIAPAVVVLNGVTISGGNAGSGDGGGIYNGGTLTISNSTISSNSANRGGGIFNDGGATLIITNSTLSSNNATFSGGGIYNFATLTITNSTISGNSTDSDSGGGIQNRGTLTITNGTLSSNRATGPGGGILNDGDATLTITNSTISGNSAGFGGGGGIRNGGTLTITSSTISGNSASGFNGFGGGIGNSGTLTITSSTISNNSASGFNGFGGGIGNYGTLTLNNSIVANSTSGGDCVGFFGTINASHSLIEDGLTCVNGTSTNNITGDPRLDGNLRLQSDSPAIDKGSNDLIPSGVTTDLAGNPRIANDTVDMGAYESFAPPTATPTPTATATATATDTPTATATATPTSTPTATATATETATATPTTTSTATATGTATETSTPTATSTGTVTASVTPSSTFTGTPPPTLTPTLASAATALADNLSVQTGGAITSGSGLNIVSRDGRIGNLYGRVLALSGAYVTPNAPAEIGIQRLLDLGIFHAVNLYGLLQDGTAANTFSQPVEICLRGTGEVLFVAASDTTRTPVRLASVDRGGYACVLLPSAGLLVMVSTPSGLPPQGSAPAASPAQADTPFTAFCQVRTTALVNLRAAPSSTASILAEVPFGTTVTATARNAAGYYQVSYGGQMGYLSSAWVVEVGSCS